MVELKYVLVQQVDANMKREQIMTDANKLMDEAKDEMLRCHDAYKLMMILHKVLFELGYLYADAKYLVEELEQVNND